MSFKSSLLNLFGSIEIHPYPMFIMFKTDHYKIKGHHKLQLLKVLREGDILLRRYDQYISGLMMPGYWQHSAYYAGNEQIIHMGFGGIASEDILTFMNADDILVLRPPDPALIPEATRRAKLLLDMKVKYDYDFDNDDLVNVDEIKSDDNVVIPESLKRVPRRFYCTEFTQFIYDNPSIIVKVGSDTFYKKLSRKYAGNPILPDDLLYISFTKAWVKE